MDPLLVTFVKEHDPQLDCMELQRLLNANPDETFAGGTKYVRHWLRNLENDLISFRGSVRSQEAFEQTSLKAGSILVVVEKNKDMPKGPVLIQFASQYGVTKVMAVTMHENEWTCEINAV